MMGLCCCRYILVPFTCFLCLAVYAVSIVTPNWRIYQNGNLTVIEGLWKSCNSSTNYTFYECYIAQDSLGSTAWMKFCRMGAVLGTVCCILATVFSILFSRKPSRYTNLLLVLLHLIESGSLALTLLLYGIEFNRSSNDITEHNFKLGWSYMIGCAGVLASILTLILTVVVYRRSVKKSGKEKKQKNDHESLMVQMTDERNDFY